MIGRPDACREKCAAKSVFRNGRRLVRGIRVQQYGCHECGRYWIGLIGPWFPFEGFFALRIGVATALKAVAIFALRLPMERIACLLGVKAETVKRCVLQLTKEEVWVQVKALILGSIPISPSELEEVDLLPLELQSRFAAEPFRLRAGEFRRLSAQERRNLTRRARRIAERKIVLKEEHSAELEPRRFD